MDSARRIEQVAAKKTAAAKQQLVKRDELMSSRQYTTFGKGYARRVPTAKGAVMLNRYGIPDASGAFVPTNDKGKATNKIMQDRQAVKKRLYEGSNTTAAGDAKAYKDRVDRETRLALKAAKDYSK